MSGRELALRQRLEGRKKGGGGSEAPDTLRSTQVAEVVLLLEEGEMQGLVNGLKSVYVDQVPLENADGSRNFEDVFFAYVPGAPGQAPLPGIEAVQNEIAVGVQVNQGTPVVRTITNAAVDHVRVTIFVPQLTDLNVENGSLNGSWFEWSIEVQSAGGGYVLRHQEIIEGKTTTGYSRAVRLELTGAAPWDVRVNRLSIPPPSNIESDFVWSSYTEIQSIKLRYQHSAVAVLRLSAKAFSRVPVIAVDALNRRVQIPANYNPITRAYAGVWDGTFSEGWTACPPWVLYDVITDVRAGAGDWVAPAIANKWSLYAIGQYCDAMVSDGRGGTEPRFTCNVNIETRTEAFRLIRDLAAIFRGMVFWASDQVDFSQDAPSDPVHTFTPANVYEGRFTYSDVSEKTRHSVFICWWNDNSQFGRRVPEIYVDETLVARYGLRELELAPLGLTSRGQAARACRWARHSEEEEGEIVAFEVGSDGCNVRVGRTFKIADPNEAGERLGGRIKTATTTVVTLDAPVTLAPGETYELTVLQPDATSPVQLVTEKRTVTTAAGTTSTLTVASAFSAAPAAGSVWLLESNAVGATLWRCMGIEEVKGSRRFRITAIAHNPSKYAAIEEGLVLDRRPVSRLTTVPPRVASVSVGETPYLVGTEYRSKVTVSWPEPARGLTYRVGWRLSLGPWTLMPETSANAVDIDSLTVGLFECWVQSVNSLGNAAQLREAAPVTLLGKTAPPSDPTGITVTLLPNGVLFKWTPCPDFDYLTSEARTGASFDAGTERFEGAADRFFWEWPAPGTYTLWLKHFDTSLNESAAVASAPFTITADQLRGGLVSRTNMLPNGGFADGKNGWTGGGIGLLSVVDDEWGRSLQGGPMADGTYTIDSSHVPAVPGEWYTVSGDSMLLATSGNRYFDLIFRDAGGATLLNGPQNAIAAGSGFASGDSNRAVHAVEAQAPAGTVDVRARFVWSTVVGLTKVGCRQIKLERGRLPYTTFSDEGQLLATQSAAAAALLQLTNIASDSILSPVEKPAVVQAYNVLVSEKAGIDAQADQWHIVTEKTAYGAAVSALTTYLGTLSGWNVIPGADVAIVGATFRANFQAAYVARQALLDAISSAAAQNSHGFQAWRVWDFTRSMEGWTLNGQTATISETSLTLSSSGTDPRIQVLNIAFSGGLYDRIRARLRRVAGTGWEGNAYYTTAGHGQSSSFRKQLAAQPQSEFTVLEWDMRALTAGGTDWVSNEIIGIRLDFGNTSADEFELDWVAIGRVAPAGPAGEPQWIGRGVTVAEDTAVKSVGSNAWDSDAYTLESYAGGCYVAATAAQNDKALMFGLNSDPATDSSYTSIDYAWYLRNDGLCEIRESGVSIATFGAYAAGDGFAIRHRGLKLEYLKNGTPVRTVSVSKTTVFFADSSFNAVGGKLTKLRFGPVSTVAALDTLEANPNAWTVPLAATFNGPTTLTGLSGTPWSLTNFLPLTWTNDTGEAQEMQIECCGECRPENAAFVSFYGILQYQIGAGPLEERTVVFANSDYAIGVAHPGTWLMQITVPAGQAITTKFRLAASGTGTGSVSYQNFANRLTGVLR